MLVIIELSKVLWFSLVSLSSSHTVSFQDNLAHCNKFGSQAWVARVEGPGGEGARTGQEGKN